MHPIHKFKFIKIFYLKLDLSNFGFSRIIAIDGAKAVKKISRINTEK